MAIQRNRGVVYAGKVGANVRKTAFQCVGGPMDGHTLYLTTPSTVPMNMAGQRGRYVSDVPMGITKPILEWEAA